MVTRASLALLVTLTSGCGAPMNSDEREFCKPTISSAFSDSETLAIQNATAEWWAVGQGACVTFEPLRQGDGGAERLGLSGVGWARIRPGAPNFYVVALHEIGHALGIVGHHAEHGVMREGLLGAASCISRADLAMLGVDAPGTCSE